jgi:sugar lactone lactonase YvrE
MTIVFKSLSLFILGLTSIANAANKAPAAKAVPTSGWEATDGISAPESAYYDEETGYIYVSNVIGQPDQKDGKGTITKLSREGKVLESSWISGLNAPKGMRARKGVLWVSDIDAVVSINPKAGIIMSTIQVPGAKFLNDVAVDAEGIVYVSDTVGGKIYRIADGKVETFAEGADLESPNGLLIHEGKLFVASWGTGLAADWSTKTLGRIYYFDLKTKQRTAFLSKPLGNLDGLESDGKGGFYVSDWKAGKVFTVSAKGETKQILSGFKGAADIGFDPINGTLIVPRMGENIVSGFDIIQGGKQL